MLFSFFIQSISVCDQFKHADNPIAIVQTRSCVNIAGLSPGESNFMNVGARLREQMEQIRDLFGQNRFF
jgi:hypothetical protein